MIKKKKLSIHDLRFKIRVQKGVGRHENFGISPLYTVSFLSCFPNITTTNNDINNHHVNKCK